MITGYVQSVPPLANDQNSMPNRHEFIDKNYTTTSIHVQIQKYKIYVHFPNVSHQRVFTIYLASLIFKGVEKV